MVRNYVRKTTRGDYSKHTLEEAIEEVKAERINAYKASKKYSIPLSTIMDHLKGRRGIKSKSFGRSIAIPVQDEKRLADGLLKMEKYGCGLSRKEVLELVGQFVKKTKIKTPFKNGIPGEDWFLGFSKRNNLSLKKPQSVEVARKKSCNPEETSPLKQIQSSTNIEPGPLCPSLIQQETVTFEDLILDSIKTNAPHVVNKRRKVASGAEVITAEEVKRRIVEEKKLKQKCIPIPPVSTTTDNDNDNLCSICKCDFRHYINKKDWIQCVTCIQWVCGVCNKGSKKRQYQCERCLDSD